jgi:hypothetical protein
MTAFSFLIRFLCVTAAYSDMGTGTIHLHIRRNPSNIQIRGGCGVEEQHARQKIRFRVWHSVKGKGISKKVIECGDLFLDPKITCREVKHALSHVTNCPVSAMDVILRDTDDEEVCTLGLRGEQLGSHWSQPAEYPPSPCLHVVQEQPVSSIGWLEVCIVRLYGHFQQPEPTPVPRTIVTTSHTSPSPTRSTQPAPTPPAPSSETSPPPIKSCPTQTLPPPQRAAPLPARAADSFGSGRACAAASAPRSAAWRRRARRRPGRR